MKKFEGILRRPIPELSEHDLTDETRRDELAQEKADREEALIRHFGYQPHEQNVWYKVALCLAEQVVPAYKPPRGRPRAQTVRVQGWAAYWVALRLSGTPSDTEAFQIVSDSLGVDIKSVRNRLTTFRDEHPISYQKLKEAFLLRRENNPQMALPIARSIALSSDGFLKAQNNTIRYVQGRAPWSDYLSDDEFWDYGEETN